MLAPHLHRFERDDRCYVIDTHTCFCFECDRISWDVLEYYPREPVNRIYHLLRDRHPQKELEEVVGELEWLRVTKAILAPLDDEAFFKKAVYAGGLKKLTLAAASLQEALSWLNRAGLLLLARSREEKDITLSLRLDTLNAADWGQATVVLAEIGAAARLAGKHFRLELDIPFSPFPETIMKKAGCTFRYRLILSEASFLENLVGGLTSLNGKKPAGAFKTLLENGAVESIRVGVRPDSETFHSVVEDLHKAGYGNIVFDLPGVWRAHPCLAPEAVVDSLEANILYYVDQLLHNAPFRVEPFALLFKAIHNGAPMYRADPSGIETLVADGEGALYPSLPFLGNPRFILGNLTEGVLDETRCEAFLLSGALQTPECLRCWARGLCGGGHVAIHYARSGDIRHPDAAWCDAQRRWTGAVVAAFNRIASVGINFDHLAASMGPRTRRFSLLGAAKALFKGQLGLRPLLEGDATVLVQWENWNRSAYFLCNETGALTATRYDREMDALHPPPYRREWILTRMNGTPCGLLKLQPVPEKQMARAWLYLHDEELYAKSALQHTLQTLLSELCREGQLRHILTPVTANETKLAAALTTAGFVHAGTERESLYLQGVYQDVDIYTYSAED